MDSIKVVLNRKAPQANNLQAMTSIWAHHPAIQRYIVWAANIIVK
jgi:hypothetical protein